MQHNNNSQSGTHQMNQMPSSSLEQQLNSLRLKQQNYGNAGLEVIQESERSSLDNNQHLEFNERRQILKDSIKKSINDNQRGSDDDETFEYQQKKQVQDLRTKISQLESDLIKEKASNQIYRKEYEKKSGSQSVPAGSFANDETAYQIEQLTQLLQQKDQAIQRLNQQLQLKNSDLDSDKSAIHQNLYNLNNKIIEMEEQLVKIQLENERLNSIVESKNKTIQMYQKQKQEEFEGLVNDQINIYQSQVDKVIQENESLVQSNEKINFLYQQLEEDYRKLQLKQTEKAEEVRLFWKDHFQKAQNDMQIRLEREKNELQQQIDKKNQLNSQLQQQLRVNTEFVAEQSQVQSQMDTQLILAKNMDQQIKDYQQTIERQRKDLFEYERQLLNTQSHITLVERKIVELQNINNTQNDQMQKLLQFEIQTSKILEENAKLKEIALIKDKEAQEHIQQAETERSSKDQIAEKIQQEFEQKLNQEREIQQNESDKAAQERNKLIEEIAQQTIQLNILQEAITSFEQQISILEEDKEKLLVIVSDKAQLEVDHQCSIDRNTDLELKVNQLLENNRVLNQNLNSRINEVNIWMQRFEKSLEENKKLNEAYQQQIAEISQQTDDELLRAKEKFDLNMTNINESMSKLEEQLNQFQLAKLESENLIRKEYREKLDKLREQNTTLNEEVTTYQKCLVELEQKHKQIIHQQQDDYEKEQQKLKLQIHDSNKKMKQSDQHKQKKGSEKSKQEGEQQEGQNEEQDKEQIEGNQNIKQTPKNNIKNKIQQKSINNIQKKEEISQVEEQSQRQAEPNQYVLFGSSPYKQKNSKDNRRQPSSQHNDISSASQDYQYVFQQQQYPHDQMQYGREQYQYQYNNYGQQYQEQIVQLQQTIKRLERENKQLTLSKIQDYNSFQDSLRSITNTVCIGRSPQYNYQNQPNRSHPY